MDSIKQIYRIGHGPSSSHTMGPKRAASIFLKSAEGKDADHFRVTLYGSLAATGRGHLTDQAIIDTLSQKEKWKSCGNPMYFLNSTPTA